MNQRFITAVIALSLSFILHGYIGQGDTAFTIFRGNNATRMNSRLSFQSSELLQYAAKTGQSKWIEMTGFHQTVITQDGVNITLDCESLLTGVHSGGNISWSRLSLSNKGQIDTYKDPISIADGAGVGHYSLFGTGRSKLSLSTSIRRSAGDTILNSGIFKCEVCSVTESFSVFEISISPECSHRNTTLFVVGGPPVIDAGHSTDDPVDQMYKVGTDFCLKRLQSVRLECGLLNSFDKKRGTSSPAFPPPLLTWTLNNNLVYREKINDSNPLINMTFLMTGDNMLLAPGLIYPPPLAIEGNTIQLDLRAINTSRVPPELFSQNRLLEILLGSWTCTQSNVYGSSSATTIITDCGEPSSLSFSASQYVVSESQGSVEVCVHQSGEVSQFQVFTSDKEAKVSVDYVGMNVTMNISSRNKCFMLDIINDNASEAIESFYLQLDSLQSDVSFINQTLTFIIRDDDLVEAEEGSCTINEFILDDNVKKEKERVVETIMQSLPFEITRSSSPNPLPDTYTQLTKVFNRTATPKGFSRFSSSANEISSSYRMECENVVRYIPGQYNITELAAIFNKSLSRHGRDLSKARSIYGKLMCYNERARKRRRERRALEHLEPTDYCGSECPDKKTEPCHFFNCLDVDELELILGFGNEFDNDIEPCIAFLIDTTGSMAGRIASAKRVIRQVLRTQRDSTGCYVLVPFNDWHLPGDITLCASDGLDVGPITHAFAFADEGEKLPVLGDLEKFNEALENLRACGGGDGPEHSLRAMMAALEYSFPLDGKEFIPMKNYSEMIVLTDHRSKEPSLEENVTSRALKQGVSINFIVPNEIHLRDYSTYPNIASRTGGIIVYLDRHNSTSWHLRNFISKYDSERSRRRPKRSTSSESLTVPVSRFTYSLHVTALSRDTRGTIRVTLPDKTIETVRIEDRVMLYSKSDPQAGHYLFDIQARDVSVQQDVALDISFFYMDQTSTISQFTPPLACTSGKLALTSSRSSEISSMSLNETDSHGNSRLIPLTKCSNMFTCDYKFKPGSFRYQVHGIDTNGIDFTYDLDEPAVFEPNGTTSTYFLRPLNDSRITIEYSGRLNVYFELQNANRLGTANFTLSVISDKRFLTTVNPLNVILPPKGTRVINLSARVYSRSIAGGSTHNFTFIANNGCTRFSATTVVTVNSPPTPPQSTAATNICGCLNGGTCVIYTRRRRRFTRCNCTPQYTGSKCQIRN